MSGSGTGRRAGNSKHDAGSEMIYDLGGFVLSLALLLGYHGYLRLRLRGDPGYTVHEVTRNTRVLWVETVMSSDECDVLAVQTLPDDVPLTVEGLSRWWK